MSAGTGGTDGREPGRAAPRIDRRRLERVFGSGEPSVTSDEERTAADRLHDDWWRDQRPPHHG